MFTWTTTSKRSHLPGYQTDCDYSGALECEHGLFPAFTYLYIYIYIYALKPLLEPLQPRSRREYMLYK